ncbi:MAG: hydrolase [Denitrovibrio sp.]|nr:MAG: hydrolase [Denitrovibrio sp.]
MKIIDLTHDLCEGMPVYPGTEPPQIKIATTIENDGFEERLLTMFSHTGTHMDAPCHILKGQKSLSDYDISEFMGKAVLINVQNCESIDAELIMKYADKLRWASFVVFYSGWDKFWGDERYFQDYPVLTIEATKILISLKMKAICMDMISIDPADTETYDNHKLVFAENILVVENLNNLNKIEQDEFLLSCIPLNIKDGDGSPIRAFATLEK